ncbi:unnamed protein product, partial [marine sediment metagenome]
MQTNKLYDEICDEHQEGTTTKREVILIKERIATLEKSSPVCVPIETFAPEPYEVLKPFHVVMQTRDD